ncbi:MAG: M48 family metallopeptidase [Geminicoccaceae bacterium]
MTIAFAGSFYDGRSSKPHPVAVKLDMDGGTLVIEGDDVGRLRFPLDLINIAPRVGDTPRFIYLDGGASLEIEENEAVDALAPRLPRGRFHLAQHAVESKLRWIVAALVLAVAFGWATIEYGVPYLAKKVAFALPHEVDQTLGDGVLVALDEFLFEETTLDANLRAELERDFARMVETTDLDAERVQLVFRASPRMGANALALPSGTIVMTDELVRLAEQREEILAVLAHEIGHIRHRHSLRGVLQSSTVALMIASLTGDLASLTSISATLPATMVQLKYSRGFELEADDYAVGILGDMGIQATELGEILLRMTGERAGEESGELSDYLSTHPGSAERMKRIKEKM